ncbi:hypothetical protein NC653_033704 [Populus alba x Populus x berolinensis]|uniref:Uncharacterized protein n=1 Tax=Populus alba x Populus x berolinensis TaxID=444605 RepID=A0AAD6LUA1_9ROSI|nr:hypothetical protein NC653_033704 [Populus alba x Populus x berolinensis]
MNKARFETWWQTLGTGISHSAKGELTKNPLSSFVVERVQNAIQIVSEDFINSWIDYFGANTTRPCLDSSFCIPLLTI